MAVPVCCEKRCDETREEEYDFVVKVVAAGR